MTSSMKTLSHAPKAADIVERREAERKIGRLTDLYAALIQTSEAVTRLASADEMFDEVCRIAVEFGRFSMAGIVLLVPQTGGVTAVAAAGDRVGGGAYLTARSRSCSIAAWAGPNNSTAMPRSIRPWRCSGRVAITPPASRIW